MVLIEGALMLQLEQPQMLHLQSYNALIFLICKLWNNTSFQLECTLFHVKESFLRCNKLPFLYLNQIFMQALPQRNVE